MGDREQQLEAMLVEFTSALEADFSVEAMLDRLLRRIVETLSVTGAGVMLLSDSSEPHFAAASNAKVLRIESLQNELHEGPCWAALRGGKPVSVPDLSLDEQFRRFSPRAWADGMAAVFTFPLRRDDHRLGALHLYRDTVGQLPAADARAAQVLADAVAAYLHDARAADTQVTTHLLRFRGLHDPLTGLPNRALFQERLDHAAARACRSQWAAAVLFICLDDFTSVNDRFGSHIGDLLLIAVAARLTRVLRPGDTVARLSGDEFVILGEDLRTPSEAGGVASRVAATLAEPFEVDGERLTVAASVGVAFAGPGQDIAEALLGESDFAMYQGTAAGGTAHQVIDQTARRAFEDQAELKRDLQMALRRDQLRLVYQPIVDLRDGRILAVEALLRWDHPQRGVVGPNITVPLAERTGLILDIGEWVLRQSCQDHQRWARRYGPSAVSQVAVNVSARQVMGPAFAATVARVLTETGSDPASVFLEVTESLFLDDPDRAAAVLHEVKDLGVGLSLDDFGVGYSSLNYLRRFPFDVIKIDRSFIGALGGEFAARSIVASVIELAHALHLTSVAEGVETRDQYRQVIDLGSDRAQGYHLSHPLSAIDLEQQLFQSAAGSPVRLPRAQR